MLANHGIKFLDLHFVRLGALVLGGGVIMAGVGGGNEFDFIAHIKVLLNPGAGSPQVGEHLVDPVFVDQTQTIVADPEPHPAVFAFYPDFAVMQIGEKTATRFVVGVGNIVSHLGPFTRDLTNP